MRIFALFLLLCCGVWGAETIRIGLALPLTGNSAHAGENCRKAAQLKAEELEKENTRYKYEFIFEDDEAQPAKTNLAVRRLLDYNKVDTVVAFGSAQTALLPTIARSYDRLFWGLSAHHEAADGKKVFAFWSSYPSLTELALKATQKQGYKRVAIIYARRRGMQDCSELFIQKLPIIGAEAVSVIPFNPGERDFRTEVLRMREAKPDVIFVMAWMPEVAIIVQRIKEMGMTTPLSSMESFAHLPDKTLIEGSVFVSGVMWTEEFERKFKTRWGAAPTFAEPHMYDSLSLIVEAYETAKAKGAKPTRAEAAEALRAIEDYQGAVGRISVPEEGKISPEPRIVRVMEGKLETVGLEEIRRNKH